MTGLLYARDAILALLLVIGVFELAAWLDRRDDRLDNQPRPYDWEEASGE